MKILWISHLTVILLIYSIICWGESTVNEHKAVQTYFDSQINDEDIPGVQYLVVDANQTIYQYMGGWADIALQKPMKANITMMAYSQTKTITAAAILKLYQTGKLDLEANVNSYLLKLPYKKPMTIRQLLAQTSGLPDPIPLRWAHVVNEHQEFDEETALVRVLEDNPELSFEPGEKYQYSNISYWLLGKVIEKVSGENYEDYVRQHIFEPLNINKMELDYTIQNPKQHAKGYLAKYSFLNLIKGFLLDKKLIGETSRYEKNWLHINNHYLNGPAFGGLVGTAAGFSKFLQDQLKPNSLILNEKVKTLFYQQQTNSAGELIEMTLGWHIGHTGDEQYYFKEGGGGGFHSEMRIYPKQGIASVIMVNKTNFKSKKVLNHVDQYFLSSNNVK